MCEIMTINFFYLNHMLFFFFDIYNIEDHSQSYTMLSTGGASGGHLYHVFELMR